MKLIVKQDDNCTEIEITILCNKIDKDVENLISEINLKENTLTGRIGTSTHFIPISEVYYFETIDNKTFFYTKEQTFESSLKIYRIEEMLVQTTFVRVNKSTILNLKKIVCIEPEKNSRLLASLKNGEKVLVSRQYLQIIKNKLGA